MIVRWFTGSTALTACRQVTMETKASSPKVRWRAWRQAAAKAAYTRAPNAKDRGLHRRCVKVSLISTVTPRCWDFGWHLTGPNFFHLEKCSNLQRIGKSLEARISPNVQKELALVHSEPCAVCHHTHHTPIQEARIESFRPGAARQPKHNATQPQL